MLSAASQAPCILCAGEVWDPLFRTDDVDVRICPSCGLARLAELPDIARQAQDYEEGHFHHDYDQGTVEARALVPNGKANAMLGLLEPSLGLDTRPEALVVDVGCGWGDQVATLAEVYPNAAVVGVEPDRDIVAAIRDTGRETERMKVVEGVIESLDQVVTQPAAALLLMHVFEHLVDPLAALEVASSALEPGGRLVVAVPNLLDPGTRFGPKTFFHHAHVYYYTPRTLTALAAKAGFRASKVLTGPPFKVASCDVVCAVFERLDAPEAPAAPSPEEVHAERDAISSAIRRSTVVGPLRYRYNYRLRLPALRLAGRLKSRLVGRAS